MFDEQKLERNPALVAGFARRALPSVFGIQGGFAMALYAAFNNLQSIYYEYRWDRSRHFQAINMAYATLCGKHPSECSSFDDFFNRKFDAALKSFFGKEEAQRIREECRMVMNFPYSHSVYRPSYRSSMAGDYADVFFMTMINAIDFATYGMSLRESLIKRDVSLSGLDNRAALALRQGDRMIYSLIEEAVLGDNSLVKLSSTIISAIIKSGDRRSLELLGKLLLAAKGQEGLRQSILESCDSGPVESHIYFIDLILKNDLCRFSSVVRAFDTWSGLGFGDQKQKVAEKCMALAQTYLADDRAVTAGFNSSDTTEIYLALWATCCRDLHRANYLSRVLINAPEKYKRLVGWYFILHTNSESYRHSLAIEKLGVRDLEELAWVCANLYQNISELTGAYHWDKDVEREARTKKYPNAIYPRDRSEREALFARLADAAHFIGNKSTKFAESVFPWYSQELSASAPCRVMMGLAAWDRSEDLIQRLSEFLPHMDSDLRRCYYSSLLDPAAPRQRALLLNGLSDKSKYVCERVVNRLQFYELTATDVTELTGALTTQNSTLRKAIITLFKKQKEALIRPAITTLLGSQNKNQLLAGVELLDLFSQKNPTLRSEFQDRVSVLAEDTKLSQDVSIILDQVAPRKGTQDNLSAANGYGLYDPVSAMFNTAVWEGKRPQVPVIAGNELKALIVPDDKQTRELYNNISRVFIDFKDYEYESEDWQGSREKVLLNQDGYMLRVLAGHNLIKRGMENTIDDYPLADEWIRAAGDYASDKGKLAAVLSLWGNHLGYNKRYTRWFKALFADYPACEDHNSVMQKLTKHGGSRDIPIYKLNQVLNALMNTGETLQFDFAFSAYISLVRMIPTNRLGVECEEEEKKQDSSYYYYSSNQDNRRVLNSGYLSYWRNLAYKSITTDAEFIAYFNEMWYESLAANCNDIYGLGYKDLFRAHQLGLITDDVVLYSLTAANAAFGHMNALTGTSTEARESLAQYPEMSLLLERAIDRIVTIEENRGELATTVTSVASAINRFNGGIGHFVKLLAALGSDGFNRGYIYSWSGRDSITKKEILSQLLKRNQPKAGDTSDELKAALKQAKITEKRVIQAAMYAPQWAGLLERATGIAGLKCGVWFFHAHVNENFSAEKETETAIFSAITPQQFNDGTFDKQWFFEAYEALGEKNFNELYKNAKYITSSNIAHRRSQLYTDAVLGRLPLDETRAEIVEKRNQEKLRAFALIPLDERRANDALERYEFIQQFKKESKQFGSLRQASEGKAVQVALENLAITTGYGDTDRMTWALEGAKIEQLRPLMEPRVVGDAELWLSIEEDGTPEIVTRKGDKLLKTLPKTLNKDPYVLELKAACKQLRDQKSRARQSFEMAMVARTAFGVGEIAALLEHPILRGMVATLVFVAESGKGAEAVGAVEEAEGAEVTGAAGGAESSTATAGKLGFPQLVEDALVLLGADGTTQLLAVGDCLRIAHPHDLITQKQWSAYQQYLYRNQIMQPFKQVFREYYPVTEDERDAINISRRYAGNQVQPRKAVALLKTRGWTVDYEEGLQRVWHRENLIVRMFALADWFSPAEIESPTLETVQFYSRDKYELVAFADVPPVIFSETMRDIDLVVSVAHAGGVDPEASHSTIEMRVAIAGELLSMLSVDNVSFKTAHALVKGSLGEYSVHMGSGVVHKLGTGMIAVLPVHSQARGRIFLPFADDDPKTAEVLSKILLFADDKKIKDPTILSQIGSQ